MHFGLPVMFNRRQPLLAYEAFEHKYFRLSQDTYTSNKELTATNSKYQKFITGSDQVWNIRCMDADDVYYLNLFLISTDDTHMPWASALTIHLVIQLSKDHQYL